MIITTVTALLNQLAIVVPSLIAGNTVLTGAVTGAFNVQKGWARHAISWVLAVLAGVCLALTGGLTVFAAPWANIVFGAVCGLVAGGASNGLYDWAAISSLVNQFYHLFGHKIPGEDTVEAEKK